MGDKLAIDGGTPVRADTLSYGRQSIGSADIDAVVEVLRSDWLTTGPKVDEFEEKVSERVGAVGAVAVSSGTAALHVSMAALGVSSGDEVIVPTMTFAASANCAVYEGASPVFVDVDGTTLLIDSDAIREAVTPRTKAIVTVDFAGQPCDYDPIRAIADEAGVAVVGDGAHALGASYKGTPVGALTDLTTFSFHPVKQITTGEGGMVVALRPEHLDAARSFRNHGIETDHRQREQLGTWYYEMVRLGYNYRLPDLNCALGISQLARLDDWLNRRQEIAARYDHEFRECPSVRPLARTEHTEHAYHLYVILLQEEALRAGRTEVFEALRAEGIGVNVHYIPVHLHPYYRKRFGTGEGLCPRAEEAYRNILSIPIFPGMSDRDADDVIEAVLKVTSAMAA